MKFHEISPSFVINQKISSSTGKDQKILLNLAKLWEKRWLTVSCGLYYKPMMIINDDARIINKLDASLTDDSRVVIYDHHMFIVQATAWMKKGLFEHKFALAFISLTFIHAKGMKFKPTFSRPFNKFWQYFTKVFYITKTFSF